MSTQTTLEGVNQQWMRLTNALDDYLSDLKKQAIQRLQEDGFESLPPLVEQAKAQASSKKQVEETWMEWRVRVGLARPAVSAPAPARRPLSKQAKGGSARPWYTRPLVRQLPNGQRVSTMSRMTGMILHAMCALGGDSQPVSATKVADYLVGHFPLFPHDLTTREGGGLRYRYEVAHFFAAQQQREQPLAERAGRGAYRLTRRGIAEVNKVAVTALQEVA